MVTSYRPQAPARPRAHDAAGRRNAAVLLATAATVGVLFLYPTSTNRGTAQARPGLTQAPAGIVTPAPGPTSGGTTSGTTGGTGTGNTVVNGASADTVYGPVQVQLTISGGKIVSAVAIDYPQTGGRDREINSYAIPQLQQETVAAQSAQIDSVSGATYTSQGYIQSLQSALDAAHLK
jgi:uncharacterized protein with FMN-binding domain